MIEKACRYLCAALVMAGLMVPSASDASSRNGVVKADKVLVVKSERRLYLLRDDAIIAEYGVALGRQPKGRKIMEGDGRTPEGTYVIDWRNPNSRFYRSLHVSYPNAEDKERAARYDTSPGGLIMIHGQPSSSGAGPNGKKRGDWTEGCIAVTNAEIEAIWRSVDDGTPIEIRP